jgi:hypothetical protein
MEGWWAMNPNKRNLHRDLHSLPFFNVRNEMMESRIGKYVWLHNDGYSIQPCDEYPDGVKPFGESGDYRHRIIAVQTLRDGSVGYRAVVDDAVYTEKYGFEDTFGRALSDRDIKRWEPVS